MSTNRTPSAALRVLAFAASAALTAPASAGAWLLATPEPRVVPGQTFEVIVVAPDGNAEWPRHLPAQIELPGNAPRIALELTAIDAAASGGQRRYIGEWPREVVGVATLSLREAASARLLLDASTAVAAVAATAPAAPLPLAAAASPALEPQAEVAAAAPRAEPVAPAALGFHEPMYFVVGGKDPQSARYQLSFRYRLFDAQGVVGETLPLTRGLYFGFTQTSLWDLESESKPFRDTSFRPSFFYQWRLSDPEDNGSLAVAAGYEHESNGRDGTDSRSIDTLFVRADARHYFADGRTYVGVAPKLWTYIDKEDNPDITRYRGYAELGLRFGRDDGLMLTSVLRRGTAGVGSTQFDLSYPLRRSVFSGVGTFVHLQYFNGYGETLLDYDEPHHPQIRIGVSLVR